ncbi:hypothetical protein CHS0354_035199 [Potamilus streckersoni]|uniref:Oxidoreductase n=1 Tax=Potamilus streckersoni TaxID=2493646 RepID=A0AAE0S2Z6_9BIVA|nr:hypothetical protein CHS0354_035199 [Potamilus streckersoni]
MHHKIRIGMVGGGAGALIGNSHRIAMRMDNKFDLLAACFSRDPARNRQTAQENMIAPDRTYAGYSEMAEKESARPDGIKAVSVVTTNDSHFEIASAFLKKGIHVICDKPLTRTAQETKNLMELAQKHNCVLCTTYNYTGYEMVREAAVMVRNGSIGKITGVTIEHISGWVNFALTQPNHRQAGWRTDVSVSGKDSAMQDLGVACLPSDALRMRYGSVSVCAVMDATLPGKDIYDEARAMFRMENGVLGSLWVSMTTTGMEHGLTIRVVGSKASLEWKHEDPQHLLIRTEDSTRMIKSHGQRTNSPDASRLYPYGTGTRRGLSGGFANVYSDFAHAVSEIQQKKHYEKRLIDFPDGEDSWRTALFLEAALASAEDNSTWKPVTPNH